MSPELFNLVVAVALECLEEWACNELAGIDMTFAGVYFPSTLFADGLFYYHCHHPDHDQEDM